MAKTDSDKDHMLSIRDLYPRLNDEQLKQAEENLQRYLELAPRMYQRIRQDSDAYAHFKTLTDSSNDPYNGERQRSKIKPRT